MALTRAFKNGTVAPERKATPLVINGDMNVAQRSGAAVTGLGDGDEGYVTVDRFRHTAAASAGRFTSKREGVNDIGGFQNSLNIKCTTVDTSIAATELLQIDTRFEGQDCQHFKKGEADAEYITVAFYQKANAVFDFALEIRDIDNGRHISKLFTTTTAWTQVVMSFVPDTTGNLGDDANNSLQFNMILHAGSNFKEGTLAAGWASYNDANSAVGIDSIYSNTNNFISIVGFQIEAGDYNTTTIPAFQYESFGVNRSRCQRYFQRFTQPPIGGSANANNTVARASIGLFPVTMRAAPSAAQSGALVWFYSNTHQPTSTALATSYLDVDTAEFDITVSGTGLTASTYCSVSQSGAGFISFDAEL